MSCNPSTEPYLENQDTMLLNIESPQLEPKIVNRNSRKMVLFTLGGGIFSFSANSIAAYLREKQYQVTIINCVPPVTNDAGTVFLTMSDEQLEQMTGLCDDAIAFGISLVTVHQVELAAQINDYLKNLSDAPIVWGGVPVISDPAFYLQHADYVCTGEGEIFLHEFLKQIEQGLPLHHVRGMAYRTADGNMVTNPSIDMVNVNEIPLPLLDMDNIYLLNPSGLVSGKEHRDEVLQQAVKKYGFRVFQVRGCPFRCTFCANSTLAEANKGQYKLRGFTPERIVEELLEAKRLVPGLEKVMFYEDDFLARTLKDFKELIDHYNKHIGLAINANATMRQVSEEKIDYVLDSGVKFDFLKIGLQSASQRVNKELYKRPFKRQEFLDKLPMLLHRKIPVIMDMIAENPFETVADKAENLEFFADLSENLSEVHEPWKYVAFMDHKLMYYPGTPMYVQALENGYIDENYVEDVLLKRKTTRTKRDFDIDKITLGLFNLSLKHKKVVWTLRLLTFKPLLWLVIKTLKVPGIPFLMVKVKSLLKVMLKRTKAASSRLLEVKALRGEANVRLSQG